MRQFGILSMGSRLKRLSDYLFAEVQQIYVRRGIPISSTYFPILRLLQGEGALSVIEVADRLGVSHPAVSKQVAKMVRDGLLVKQGDAGDQRRFLLRLSKKGGKAMAAVEPVLAAIKTTLETLTAVEGGSFMEGFDKVEERILGSSFADAVLYRLTCTRYAVVPFSEHYRRDFAELNMAWLERYFPSGITDHDRKVLADPEKWILEKGGSIWFALARNAPGGLPVGTMALVPVAGKEYEVVKLAVAPDHQSQGVATLLLQTAIGCAEQNGATILSLETASVLEPALRLYRRLGFTAQKPPRAYSADRVDIYMSLSLPAPRPLHYGETLC